MKIFFLGFFLVLSAHTYSATSHIQPDNLSDIHHGYNHKEPNKGLKKPLKEKQLFYKGKGTVGLVLGILLGPIGFIGVHFLSHNKKHLG
jgi:hypothetical protein